MILGLLLLLFLKKEVNFDVGFLQILYFRNAVCVLIVPSFSRPCKQKGHEWNNENDERKTQNPV